MDENEIYGKHSVLARYKDKQLTMEGNEAFVTLAHDAFIYCAQEMLDTLETQEEMESMDEVIEDIMNRDFVLRCDFDVKPSETEGNADVNSEFTIEEGDISEIRALQGLGIFLVSIRMQQDAMVQQYIQQNQNPQPQDAWWQKQ